MQGENERQWKKVNEITYDIPPIRRVTERFLEVSRCSCAKQRQRNVHRKCAARAKLLLLIAGFHMSGKSQTIGAFTFCRPSQIYRIIATILSLILPMNLAENGKCAKNWNFRDGGTGAQQFGGLVMSEIYRRRPRRYKFEFSFVGNDRRPSQKSGTRRENRNAPDSPDLSPSIPDDRGYLRFRVFINRQNLGQSGSSKIPDRLGLFRHMKTRLIDPLLFFTVFRRSMPSPLSITRFYILFE